MEETKDNDSSNNPSLDSFDISGTWTLVTRKEITTTKNNLNLLQEPENQEKVKGNELKVTSNDRNEKENSNKEKCLVDSTTNQSLEGKAHEDFSDEISIISECDSSTEHLASVVNVKNHLENFHLQFATKNCNNNNHNKNKNINMNNNIPEIMQPECRAINNNVFIKKIIMFVKHLLDRFNEVKSFSESVFSFKKGLNIGFCIGLTVATLIVLNKAYNPYWEKGLSKIDHLERKIDDIEMHNNLMRGEIVLLHKQVKYLLNVIERQQNNRKYRKQNRKKNRHNGDDDKYDYDDDRDNYYDDYDDREKYKKPLNDKGNKWKNEYASQSKNQRKKNEHKKVNRRHENKEYRNGVVKNSFECSSNESKNEEFCLKAHKPNEWNKERKLKGNNNNKNLNTRYMKQMDDGSNEYNDVKIKSSNKHKQMQDELKKPEMYAYKQAENFSKESNAQNSIKYENYKEQPKLKSKSKLKRPQKQWHNEIANNYDGEWQMKYMRNRENARRVNGENWKEENWFLKRSNGRHDKRFNEHN